MAKSIWNYPGDKRSLVNDGIFLVYLRALNVAAADRAVAFGQTWIGYENPDFPLDFRTAQRSLKRLRSVGFVHKRDRGGSLPSVYYALPCSLERMSFALQNGLDEWITDKNGGLTTMYAPPDSPVCLTWDDKCQCIQILALAEKIPDDMTLTYRRPIRVIRYPVGEVRHYWQPIYSWRHRPRIPYWLHIAQYFITQLKGFEGYLGNLSVWKIPSVKVILEEIERLTTFYS